MDRLKIYRDNYADSTVVSNRFIDEYMKDANDAQLKIYLYLIRMMSANLPTSVSEIADKFNHTEKDVLRALKYWEKNRLLTLDYDENKVLTGIHLQDLAGSPMAVQTPAAVSLAPVVSIVSKQTLSSAPSSDNVSALSSSQEPQPFAKPSYSPDQLREFKDREATAQLLFVAESYVGRPLTPSDMKTILYFSDCLKFSDDLIDYLLQYCVERDKRDFRYIEAVALNWAKEGITTPKEAARFASRYEKDVYTVMKELGKTSAPTPKETEYILRWTKEYGFTLDVICEACSRTVMATDKHRFEYAEGILNNWYQEGVKSKPDITRIEELHQRKRTAKPAPANKFNQFKQNSYDFEALERELLRK